MHFSLEKRRKELLREDAELSALSSRLCMMSDLHRLKVLYLLYHEKELRVKDIAQVLGVSVSALSHQLRALRAMNMVATKRVGQEIYYRLVSDHFAKQLSCIFSNH